MDRAGEGERGKKISILPCPFPCASCTTTMSNSNGSTLPLKTVPVPLFPGGTSHRLINHSLTSNPSLPVLLWKWLVSLYVWAEKAEIPNFYNNIIYSKQSFLAGLIETTWCSPGNLPFVLHKLCKQNYAYGCTCIGQHLKEKGLWGTIRGSEMQNKPYKLKRPILLCMITSCQRSSYRSKGCNQSLSNGPFERLWCNPKKSTKVMKTHRSTKKYIKDKSSMFI